MISLPPSQSDVAAIAARGQTQPSPQGTEGEAEEESSPVVSRPRPPLEGRPKVMLRPRAAEESQRNKDKEDRPQKSLAEKEAEYMAARARIFGTDESKPPESAASETNPQLGSGVERLPIKAELRIGGATVDPDYNRNQVSFNRSGMYPGMPFPCMSMPFPGMQFPSTMSGSSPFPGMFMNNLQLPPHVGAMPKMMPTGPHLPRQLISQVRMRGRVLEWKGKYGWIVPENPIHHPKAGKHQGKVFVSTTDLMDVQTLEPGNLCEFYLFEDDAGLGAEDCSVVDMTSECQTTSMENGSHESLS